MELAPESEAGRARYFAALEAADRGDWQPLAAVWKTRFGSDYRACFRSDKSESRFSAWRPTLYANPWFQHFSVSKSQILPGGILFQKSTGECPHLSHLLG